MTRALIFVQQASFELTPNHNLFTPIADRDHWFREIGDHLYWRNAWSIATASSVAWVVIAYLFTLVDSFVSLNDGTNNPSEGQAVGTLWLWLLCLVIGWLWVPTFAKDQLETAINHANRKTVKAAKKSEDRISQKVSEACNSVKTKVTHRLSKVSTPTRHEIPMVQPVADPVLEVNVENEKVEVGPTEEVTGLTKREVELERMPLPGLHYDLSITSLQLPPGSQQDHGHLSVDASPAANKSSPGSQVSIYTEKYCPFGKGPKDRLSRDEHRFGATFNYSRFIRHRLLVYDLLRALDKFTHEGGKVGLSRNRLILEIVSLTLNRAIPLRPLSSLQGPCSLPEPLLQCSSP